MMVRGSGSLNEIPADAMAMSKGKSIKDQNRWQLWAAMAANVVAFYILMQWDEISAAGIETLMMKAANVLPLGMAVVIVTVINGILSPAAKARIVFLRWTHALPGHKAFSELADKDPRVDMALLKKAVGSKLPTDPADQNKLWYRLYKAVETRSSVDHVQRDFLLTRDYACFAFLVFFVFGTVALIELNAAKVSLLYVGAMMVQFFLVRQAAVNYAHRFVTTVLAETAAQ